MKGTNKPSFQIVSFTNGSWTSSNVMALPLIDGKIYQSVHEFFHNYFYHPCPLSPDSGDEATWKIFRDRYSKRSIEVIGEMKR